MKRLFDAVGADFDQWKALTIAALKIDVRGPARSTSAAPQAFAAGLIGQLLLYTVLGLFVSSFVWFTRDLFVVGMVATTYLMFVVASAVVLDYQSAIVSPTDYGVLGFRPITSRTYFLVRLTNVVVYVVTTTTVAAWLPALSLVVRHGVVVGLAGLVAFYSCALTTTFALLLGYTWVLRAVGPDTLKRAMSYLQLSMGFLVYGVYFAITDLMARQVGWSLALPKSGWLLLYPGTWFASYLDIAAGSHDRMEAAAAIASMIALAGTAAGLGGRLSLDYAERIGAMMTASAAGPHERQRARPTGAVWFRGGEARAVALLVRSQFRNDQRFRMGVLGILPMTLIYVLVGLREGEIQDPFAPQAHPTAFPSVIMMAVMMFPSMLKLHLTHSDAFGASWIFFASPIDRMRVIRSAKSVLVAFFLVPYLLILVALFAYFTGSVMHAAVYIALAGLLSHLVLQVAILLEPELPFSRPMHKGKSSTNFIGFTFGISLTAGLLQVLSAALYPRVTAIAALFLVILAVSGVVDRLTRSRVERLAETLEFEG